MTDHPHLIRRQLPVALLSFFFVVALATPSLAKKEKEIPQVTFDGLELVRDSEVAAAWVKPDADFSKYERILLLDTLVAFKRHWLMETNRTSVEHVTNNDVERMKSEMAKLFREVFVKVLDQEGGYPMVESPDRDVLLLRPAIVDLDVTAPALGTADRTYKFAASAGAATLYLEIFDSVSGEILARAIDRKSADNPSGVMKWTTTLSNRQAAEEMLSTWANLLKGRLDEIHASAKE